jgi:UDP-N-acetylmuramate dehydrogenase
LWNVPLSDYTSFRIGGPADAFLLPESEGAFLSLLAFLKSREISFRVIGNGTNLLFSDSGFRGAIISTRHMRNLFVVGQSMRAAAGVPLGIVCRTLADRSLGGFASLYGIPGTVGGAVVMNAGAFGGTVSDHLTFVSVYRTDSGRVETLSKSNLQFSYRNSSFRTEKDAVVLSAEFLLPQEDSEEIREKMRRVITQRMATQPTALPCAGSAFLKPETGYAAAWIEKAGLSGLRVGGAAVSVKHAGFIVNLGGATAEDVKALIAEIQKEVFARFGVCLHPEIEYIE